MLRVFAGTIYALSRLSKRNFEVHIPDCLAGLCLFWKPGLSNPHYGKILPSTTFVVRTLPCVSRTVTF